MKIILLLKPYLFCLLLIPLSVLSSPLGPPVEPEKFVEFAQTIDPSVAANWPIQHNGRYKPFQTMAREVMLFLSGKYNIWGLSSTNFYFGLMFSPQAAELPFIEVRSVELREKLGFSKDQKYYSLTDLRGTSLSTLAQPLFEKQQSNKRQLTELENKIIESAQQMFLAEEIIHGAHLMSVLNLQMPMDGNHQNMGGGTLADANIATFVNSIKSGLKESQKLESEKVRSSLLKGMSLDLSSELETKIPLEIFYNRFNPFLFSAAICFMLALLLWVQVRKEWLTYKSILFIATLPILFQALGFFIRIYITGFSPVTNMYGTMLWVSFGVSLFSLLFLIIYRNYYLTAGLYFFVFLMQLLTHNIPLILSPDMDPIVAVLRSNFWLSTHVLTITISYAAFTMAMFIGNLALIRYALNKVDSAFVKTYSHYCYRAIQLGVLLLTAGIILGGVWADYSWGRFWGWDPKETWALIADLGFITLLHARFIKWIGPLGLLAFSPFSYLLVIMAWYGVNFILSSGLHSYGFSSGGLMIINSFLFIQLFIYSMALMRRLSKSQNLIES